MKLRNKKTGRILEAEKILFGNGCIGDGLEWNTYQPAVSSLAELNEEWEDYTPSEPLIKDEKVRKAVRAWAEACGVNRVVNGEYDNELCAKGQQFYGAKIVLTKTVALPRGRNYTIAELCGEEEE